MRWEQRLRDMVLAGGAVASAACGGATAGSTAGSTFDGGASDATSSDASTDAAGDVVDSSQPNFCCNASPDPCCAYYYCEASLSSICKSEMTCEAGGGTWDPIAQKCVAGVDAGAPDATADDALDDASAEPDGRD